MKRRKPKTKDKDDGILYPRDLRYNVDDVEFLGGVLDVDENEPDDISDWGDLLKLDRSYK